MMRIVRSEQHTVTVAGSGSAAIGFEGEVNEEALCRKSSWEIIITKQGRTTVC